jgi:hypothetical protein
MVSFATQLYCCGLTAAIDNIQMKENGGVPIKLYLQKRTNGPP